MYLNTLDCPIEEFYVEVRNCQNDRDPYIHAFVECLLASADYESFYKVMAREGKKKEIAASFSSSQAKAEAKIGGDGHKHGSGGGGGGENKRAEGKDCDHHGDEK